VLCKTCSFYQFFAKIQIFNKTIYNLDASIENREELNGVFMMNDLFKRVNSILTYVQVLDGKIDSLIQNKNNTYINQSINDKFEKIFPFKYVESVDDMENLLKWDENTSNQLVFM